jgi:hypothetical protein
VLDDFFKSDIGSDVYVTLFSICNVAFNRGPFRKMLLLDPVTHISTLGPVGPLNGMGDGYWWLTFDMKFSSL